MTKSLSKILLSLTVTPFLMFGTPALMVTSANADSEITTDVSEDDGAWSESDSGSDGGDSGWGEGDGEGWGGEEEAPGSSSGDDCSGALSVARC